MSNRYLVPGGDGDFDNTINWSSLSGGASGASVPTSADDVICDINSGSQSLTLNSSSSCASFTTEVAYSGDFDQNSQDFVMFGAFNFDGIGTCTVDGGQISISGTFHIGSAATGVFNNATQLRYTANGDLDIDASQSGTNAIKTIDIDSGVTVNQTSSITVRNDNATSITLADNTSTLSIASVLTVRSGGTCKPIEDNGGTLEASGYFIDFRPFSASSNITLPMVSCVGGTVRFYPAVNNCMFTADGTLCLNKLVVVPLGGGLACTVDMDTYDLETTGNLELASSWLGNGERITFNAGSGTHTIGNTIDFSASTNNFIDFNLESSTIKVAGSALDFTVNGTLTLNKGTGTIELNGTGTQQITFDGKEFNIFKVSNTAGEVQIMDSSECERWIFEPGSTLGFKESVSHTLNSYVAGDIDGVSGSLVELASLSSGTDFDLINPVGMNLNFVSAQDSNATNDIKAYTDNGNVDGGGNTNWIFTSSDKIYITIDSRVMEVVEYSTSEGFFTVIGVFIDTNELTVVKFWKTTEFDVT